MRKYGINGDSCSRGYAIKGREPSALAHGFIVITHGFADYSAICLHMSIIIATFAPKSQKL